MAYRQEYVGGVRLPQHVTDQAVGEARSSSRRAVDAMPIMRKDDRQRVVPQIERLRTAGTVRLDILSGSVVSKQSFRMEFGAA